jgi:uncharacterized protein YodC (DUF2158 family)
MRTSTRTALGWLVALALLAGGMAAGCSKGGARLPDVPQPEVAPQELLVEHNAWADLHRTLLEHAALPRLTSAPALVEVFRGFRIEPKPDRQMRLDDDGPHAVLSEYAPDGVLALRVWFNRYSLRPEHVEIRNRDGRLVVDARMLAYERIGSVEVCSSFQGRFHGDEEVRLDLHLAGLDRDGRPRFEIADYGVLPTGSSGADQAVVAKPTRAFDESAVSSRPWVR